MRTTYYHFIDSTVGIGITYHTLANGTVNEFGIGISSYIGIGTVNNVYAPFAIHHDGPASESNRTGGLEIVGNSNSSGDKHGARILAYNRVFANKGYRRLRFQASEYQFETPTDGNSTNNAGPTFNITGFGSVGIGSTDPLAKLDVRGDVRFNNKLYDKDGDSGTSGQVLSSTGTQIDWINVGELSAGTASQVAVTASNDDQNFNVTFVDSSSGNQSIKADTNTNFIYNPSINRLELNTFSGTGLMLSGSGSEYVGMQLKTSDSSASQTRNIFIDTVNELGNAIANQVGQVQSDGGSHWRWETQPPGDRTDRRVERLRITGLGSVGIGTDNPVTKLDVFGNIRLSDSNPEIQLNFGGPRFRVPADNTLTIHSGGDSGSESLERVRITSLGNVGIGTTNTVDFFDGGFERRLVVYGGGAQVGSAYTWTGGDFYHAEDIITAVTKSKSGGFAINCRDQEVSATDPSKPVWTLRSYSNEPIAFGQGLTEIARFDENGNLGIGTTSPSVKLDVIGSATVEGDLFLREVPSDGICKINGNGNLNLFADVQVKLYESDNNKLMITFDINTVHNDSRIFMEDDNDTYLNHPDENQLGFTVGGTDTLRLIQSAVGLGTTNPQERLHVVNTSSSAIPLLLERTHDNNVVVQYKSPTLTMFAGIAGEGLGWGVGTAADLGSSSNNNLMVKPDGKIGIGTVSPNSLLHLHQSSTSGFDGLRLTNSTTGVSATSGFSIELTDNETTRIWNYGNESISFGVDNELHGTLRQDGRWCLGPNQTSGSRVLNVFSTNGPSAIFLSDNDAGIEIKDSSDSSVVELTNNNGQLKIDLDHTAQVTGEAFIIEKNGGSTGTAELFRIDSEGQVIFKSMTTTERNALSAQTGGVIYNSSTNKLQVYTGSAWVNLH